MHLECDTSLAGLGGSTIRGRCCQRIMVKTNYIKGVIRTIQGERHLVANTDLTMNAAEINVHRGCRVCDATVVRDCLSKQRYIRCCYAGKTGCIIHARSSRSGSRRLEGCSHSAGFAGGCGMVCASRNTDGNGRIASRVIHAGNCNSRAGNSHLCHTRIVGTRTDNTVTSPRNGNRL